MGVVAQQQPMQDAPGQGHAAGEGQRQEGAGEVPGGEASMSQDEWSRMSPEDQAQYWQQWEAYYNAWQRPSEPSPAPYADPYQPQHQQQPHQLGGQLQWQVLCALVTLPMTTALVHHMSVSMQAHAGIEFILSALPC